jgi:phosphoenolpyruvate synthase/pyruvate phosphate dikinase
MSTVLGLRELGRDDIARAGGKGANLGELIKAGFDVPDGFVLTTEVYAAALRLRSYRYHLRTRPIPPRFREQVCRVPLPENTRREIATAYADLGAGPVAVRSSATAEDLPVRPSPDRGQLPQCHRGTAVDRCDPAVLGLAMDRKGRRVPAATPHRAE